jgi:predicted secreted hydrolase
MLFEIRQADGSVDPYSAGTFIDAGGRATHLKRGDFQLQPLEFWTSPATHARYPVRWRVTIPSLHVTLECAAAIPDQELGAEDAASPPYWEGAVTYTGSATGVGYLEMTGYAKPMRL